MFLTWQITSGMPFQYLPSDILIYNTVIVEIWLFRVYRVFLINNSALLA